MSTVLMCSFGCECVLAKIDGRSLYCFGWVCLIVKGVLIECMHSAYECV